MWGEIVPSNIKEGQRPGENLKKVWLQNSAFEFDIVFQNCCWNQFSRHHEYFIKLTAVFFSMSVYLIVQRTFLFTLKMIKFTGFELNVGVVFIDDFRPEMREAESECRFTFHSGDQKRGTVSNVPYDLPGNSTCTYSFQENYLKKLQ